MSASPPEPAHRPQPTPTVSRRTLVASSALGAVTLTTRGLAAQEGTPVAVDPDAFRNLNLAITGADDLDDDGLQQLLDLFLADEGMAEALDILLAEHATAADFDVRTLDFSLVVVVTNILQFWYLGTFRNEPLANRPERVARLTSYQALPYFTAPAVCKAFGYWATDPGLD
jgi:hypothetical protein